MIIKGSMTIRDIQRDDLKMENESNLIELGPIVFVHKIYRKRNLVKKTMIM